MTTFPIKTEKDFEKVFEAKFGVKCTIESVKDLYDAIDMVYTTKYAAFDLPREIDSALDYSYAPTVHIAISKQNAYAMDEFFKELKCGGYGTDWSDYTYLDTDEYDEYDSIDDVPTDRVDFTFTTELVSVNTLIEAVAEKLYEIGENADFIINWLFPYGHEGTILGRDGEEMANGRGLLWKINDGKIIYPDGTLVIFGDDDINMLLATRFIFTELTVAQWKELCGVDIEIR